MTPLGGVLFFEETSEGDGERGGSTPGRRVGGHPPDGWDGRHVHGDTQTRRGVNRWVSRDIYREVHRDAHRYAHRVMRRGQTDKRQTKP